MDRKVDKFSRKNDSERAEKPISGNLWFKNKYFKPWIFLKKHGLLVMNHGIHIKTYDIFNNDAFIDSLFCPET